jgi:hypothetical protein
MHQSAVQWAAQKEKSTAERIRNETAFWNLFSTLEDQLYLAKTDGDPAIIKLQAGLRALSPDLSFQIGPVHSGRRELAFIKGRHIWVPADNIPGELIKLVPPKLHDHWYVGYGFPQPTTIRGSNYRTGEGTGIWISSKDICFVATRNKNTIDVELFTDSPLTPDTDGESPVDKFLRKNPGERLCGTLLGNVTVKKMSELGDRKAQDITLIYTAFVELLTPAERKQLEQIVTTQPCVVSTVSSDGASPATTQRLKAVPSPYLKLRHQHGCLKP